MKIYKIKAGLACRLMNTDGYIPFTTRKEVILEREDLVLDAIILHNTPDTWITYWPELDSLDGLLFPQYIRAGEMVFHRAGHYLAIRAEYVEVIA